MRKTSTGKWVSTTREQVIRHNSGIVRYSSFGDGLEQFHNPADMAQKLRKLSQSVLSLKRIFKYY